MTRPVKADAHLEHGGRWWHVSGSVWLGTTGPAGPDPTEVVEWMVVGGGRHSLLHGIYDELQLTDAECVEHVEQALIDAARGA